MDSEEAQLLYDTSAQLIAAAAPEAVLRAVSQLGPPAKSSATLFTIESAANGQPQWLRIAAHTDSANASVPPPDPRPRLELAAAPLPALWVRHPDRLQLIGDVIGDPRVDPGTREQCQSSGAAALAVLPLFLGDHFIGLIRLTWSAPQIFTERDERLFGALGKLAALSLEHRALLTQTQSAGPENLRQKSELQAVLEALPVGVVIADCQTGVIQQSNQAALNLLGRGHDPARGKDDYPETYKIYHPGKDTLMAAGDLPLVRAMSGHLARRDLDIVRPDGTRITVDAVGAPIRDAAGAVVSAVVTFLDVTPVRERQSVLEALVDNSPSAIFAKDPVGRYLFINRKMETFLGKSRQEILGRADHEIWPEKIASVSVSQDQQVIDSGQQSTYEETVPDGQGNERTFHKVKFPLFDSTGKVVAICGLATDITEARRIASERLVVQQKVIDAQSAELQELSTPLIPLAVGVVVMPLVGSIDNRRADQIMIALLDGIAQQRAHMVIVDITGVRTVDTHVANALIRAARSAKLLGARVVLTGIGAAVAQTLVQLGIDLGDVMTLNNLQSGIQYALGKSRLGSA